jgi:1,4-dihydroxy-2-naphthoate polyprenyltransferase
VLFLIVNPWLLLIGAAAIVAAATYTGGPKPYGYSGFGELMVLVFFGFVGTLGSAYVQHKTIPVEAWYGAIVVGLPACAIMLTNNIRDIASDTVAGKRTLAVRLGSQRARRLYVACIVAAMATVGACGVIEPWTLIAFLAAPLAIAPARNVVTRDDPPGLIAALVGTSRFLVVLSVLFAAGLWIS